MKVAIIGSRNLTVTNLEKYLPENTTEIISGGAAGIDRCAKEYALSNGLEYTEFLPEYSKYGRRAPLVRNDIIIRNADFIIAFWDGSSHGTKYVIDCCRQLNKDIVVFLHSK